MAVKKFVVFFSVDFSNTNEAARIVLLRRYLETGIGKDISIIDEALLTENMSYPFWIIAEAPGQEELEAALEPCKGVYVTQIVEANLVTLNKEVAARYCVFASRPLQTIGKTVDVPLPSSSVVSIRTKIDLAEGAPVESILLLDAAFINEAEEYAKKAMPGFAIMTTSAMLSSVFFDRKFGSGTAKAPADLSLEAVSDSISASGTPIAAAVGDSGFKIHNESSVPAFYSDIRLANGQDAVHFWQRYINKGSVPANTDVVIQSKAYLWRALPGQMTYSIVDYRYPEDTISPHKITVPAAIPLPDMVIPYTPNTTVGFNLSVDNSSHAYSTIYVLLNEVLTKTTAPWPEDSYSGAEKKAYDYFVKRLPSIPKEGNLSPAEVLEIDFPNDADFSKDAFMSVRQHLHQVCIYFDDLRLWFGLNGIFNMINTQVAVVSGTELQAAAALMSIPPPKSIVMEILDTIINDIASLVSLIPPPEGAAIAAVIRIGWSIAKVTIDTNDPGATKKPIQATVAEMAQVINNNLDAMVQATSVQYGIIAKDWGKLQQFGLAKEKGIISEKQFGAASSPTGKATALSQGYISAAANAWATIIYKSLFATNHTVTSNWTYVDDISGIPANPWNPAAGNYNFYWSLPCIYFNGTKDDHHKGFMLCTCSTDAPVQVLQQLFGPGPSLNVDPYEFFIGFNGWPQVIPNRNNWLRDIPVTIQFGW